MSLGCGLPVSLDEEPFLEDVWFEVSDAPPGATPSFTRVESVGQYESRSVRLVAKGGGFEPENVADGHGSWIVLNGRRLTTTYVDDQTLTAEVPSEMLLEAGAFPVRVDVRFEDVSGSDTTWETDDNLVEIHPVTFTNLEIVGVPAEMPVGGISRGWAIATREDGTRVDVTEFATWTSSDGDRVSVDPPDELFSYPHFRAHVEGSVEIAAGFHGLTAQVDLTTFGLQSIEINESTDRVEVFETRSLTVTGTKTDGTVVDVTPFAAVWSDNEDIAFAYPHALDIEPLDGIGPRGMSVDAEASGTTTLVAKIGDVEDRQPINVVELTHVRIEPENLTTTPGDVIQYTATGVYDDGSEVDFTDGEGWFSDNKGDVIIDNSGLTAVDAEARGTYLVSKKIDRFGVVITGRTNLEVVAPPVTGSGFAQFYGAANNGVTLFEADEDAGTFGAIRTYATGIPPQSIGDVPFAQWLVAGRRGLAADAATYTVDPITGELTTVAGSPFDLQGSALVTVAGDPTFPLVGVSTGSSPRTVTWYEVDPATPGITPVQGPLDNETVFVGDLAALAGPNGASLWYALEQTQIRGFSVVEDRQDPDGPFVFTPLPGSNYDTDLFATRWIAMEWIHESQGCAYWGGDDGVRGAVLDAAGTLTPITGVQLDEAAIDAIIAADQYLITGTNGQLNGYEIGPDCDLTPLPDYPVPSGSDNILVMAASANTIAVGGFDDDAEPLVDEDRVTWFDIDPRTGNLRAGGSVPAGFFLTDLTARKRP